jgi:cytochrome c-type biogenesis protein CcmH
VRAAALALIALVLATPAAASEQRPTAAELESELVCPVCETTLDTSNAPVALRMKAFIRERIAAGDTKSEIKAALVDQFGPAVLAVPPKKGFELIAWVLPLAGLGLGVIVVGLLAWRWSHARGSEDETSADPAEPLDPALERRLDDELARFE